MVDSLSTDVGGLTMSDYGARILRRWWITALCVVLGLVAALAYASYNGKEYNSTSLVLVTPTDALQAASAGRGGSINLDTEAQIVRSVGVANASKTLMRSSETSAKLLHAVAVTVPPNSQVLAITYTASTPRGAQGGSHAFAQAYLDQRTGDVVAAVKAQTATLTGQISDLTTQLKKVTGQIASLPSNSSDRAYAEAQKTILSSQIMALNSRLAPLREASPTPGRIITDAPLPIKPSSPSSAIVVIGGLMAGLLLGLALAALVGWADRRVRRPADVTHRTTLPVLGSLRPTGRRKAPGPVPGEDVDRVRNVLTRSRGQAPVMIQVMTTSRRAASASVSLPLSASLAQSGPTVLVLLQPDSPIPGWLGVPGGPGLSEYLAGEARLGDVLHKVDSLPGLSVIGCGLDPTALRRLVASELGGERLAALRTSSAHVVLDTPDITKAALSQSMVAKSDIVILAAEIGRTNLRGLVACATEVERFDGVVAGVVLAPSTKRSWRPPSEDRPDQSGPGRKIKARVELKAGQADEPSGTRSASGLAEASANSK
jgi:capsular polysaccharide biosynthesis protein